MRPEDFSVKAFYTGTSKLEEALGQIQNKQEELYFPKGLGTPQDPPGKVEKMVGEKDIWVTLLRLLQAQA